MEMITIPEAKEVKAGEYYIVINPFGDGRSPMYVKIDVWKARKHRIMFAAGPAWWDYEEAVKKGARFFGPIGLAE